MPILSDDLTHGLAFVAAVVGLPPRVARSRPALSAVQHLGLTALIDTGTSVTCIDPRIVQALNLRTIGTTRQPVYGAFAPAAGVTCWRYRVSLTLVNPNGNPAENLTRQNLEIMAIPISGADVLVGTDILIHCEFRHNGLGGRFSLFF
ncbi:MAG TPA: hypothetical protein VG013_43105 [Gemmataceae bacterium]|jgi:hypothetical protein|nr:hypothetical protein [Gemmataceae bacterium]